MQKYIYVEFLHFKAKYLLVLYWTHFHIDIKKKELSFISVLCGGKNECILMLNMQNTNNKDGYISYKIPYFIKTEVNDPWFTEIQMYSKYTIILWYSKINTLIHFFTYKGKRTCFLLARFLNWKLKNIRYLKKMQFNMLVCYNY